MISIKNFNSIKTEEKLKHFYKVGWEVIWAKKLDSKYNPLFKPYKNRMLDTIKLIKEELNAQFKLLDVGCGIGIYSINILKRFPNCTVIGFDISEKQIDFITKKIMDFDLHIRCKFFTANVENFNLNQRFDYIICTELLEHLPNPKKTLENIYNQGNTHTKFIFSVPHIYDSGKSGWFYRQFIDQNKWIETQDFSKINSKNEYYEYYHKEYPVEEINSLLENNKFRVLEIKYSNLNFKNKYINYGYSLMAYHKLDKILNKIFLNRFASQITLLCGKRI